MLNIYFLESAPQVLSAYQACQYYSGNNVFIIRTNGKALNDLQIEKTIDVLKINNLGKIIKGMPLSMNVLVYLLILALKSRVFKTRFLMGDCRGKFGGIIKKLISTSKNILIDDGIASLTYFHDQKDQQTRKANQPFDEIYTALPLKDELIVNHRFESLATSSCKFKILEDSAIFIGSKVVEVGLISQCEFEKSIDKFIAKNSDKKLFYIAHRAEKLNKLDKYRSKMEIKYLDLPIELDCISRCVLPKVIEGFYSGAFLFFKHLDLKLIIANHEIKKTQSNFGFHVAISRCNDLFAKIRS